MPSGFRLGKIFGIEVSLNWSWFIIFLIVTLDLALGVFPVIHPEWGAGLRWGLGLAASLLFFGSVLVHELAHSLVARARGLPVDKIILFFFGGVSNIEKEPPSPATEFIMAFVGPLTSIVLGAVFLFLGVAAAGSFRGVNEGFGQVLSNLNPLATLLLWLGPVNIILGLFNLVPGFPLDGGRVLRSIIWAVSGNLKRATRYASAVGQAFGWLLVGVGLAMIFGFTFPFFGGGLFGGLWLVFIGWFLASIAVQGYQQVLLEDILKDVSVSSIMRSNFPTVPPDISVGSLVNDYIMGSDSRTFLVMEGEKLTGIVTLEDIKNVPRSHWQSIKVGEIMTPEDELQTIGPDDKALDALQKITSADVNQLPVLKDGRLVGLVSRRDILLWLQTHSEGEFKAE